jgi:putative membrane protein
MLRYDTKAWWKLIFQFHEGDTLRTLLPNISVVALFSLLVVYFNSGIMPGYLKYTATVHNLFGFVISLLLVFRTNTAYDRWWEGRRLWGSLVNTSRNIALKCHSYLSSDDSIRETIAFDISYFAEVLKNHLRGYATDTPYPVGHAPSLAAEQLFMDISDLNRQEVITEVQFLTLNGDLSALSDICGACERIKRTPIPFSYHVFIKKFVFFYIISMPFVFAPEFGYWTILVTSFMFYVLASLETLAEEIENPFGVDTNDLPLDELCTLIKKNAYEILIDYPVHKGAVVMASSSKTCLG